MAELAMRFDLFAAQIAVWKKQLVENAADVLEGTVLAEKQGGHDPEVQFAWIGRLKMENDLLKECRAEHAHKAPRSLPRRKAALWRGAARWLPRPAATTRNPKVRAY